MRVYLLELFIAFTTQLIIMKFILYMVRSTEKDTILFIHRKAKVLMLRAKTRVPTARNK